MSGTMGRRSVRLIALALLLAAAAGPATAARDTTGRSRTLRLVVSQSYAADSAIRDGRVIEGDFAIRRVAPFPFRRLARRLLAHAGATLVDEEDAHADAVLAIDVDGTALGRLYDIMENMQRGRSLRFNGALVRGELSLDTGAGTVCVARFAGAVVPVFKASAQSWLVTFDLDQLEGSSFENTSCVVAGGEVDGVGVMALWQKCVHLGCRVPSCVPSQGFECPCHGSKYNIHGEYEAGPAPRNLDRFGVEVNDAGDLIVQTGVIVETARSKNKTAQYPQGPFCV